VLLFQTSIRVSGGIDGKTDDFPSVGVTGGETMAFVPIFLE
jgi:hypothetical protein